VRKENNRRNILLNDNDIYQDQLFNFNPNFTFNHILEIYGIDTEINNMGMKNSSKLNDDFNMMNNDMALENMSTLPQTFDPFMDCHLELPEVNLVDTDSDLNLKRR
jgi:hypothetical protein